MSTSNINDEEVDFTAGLVDISRHGKSVQKIDVRGWCVLLLVLLHPARDRRGKRPVTFFLFKFASSCLMEQTLRRSVFDSCQGGRCPRGGAHSGCGG